MDKRRVHKEWTPEEDAVLIRMAADGHSGGAVGKRLGRSRCSIMGRGFRLGVKFKGKPPKAAAMVASKKRAEANRRNWKKPLREYTPKQQPGIEGRTVTRLRRLGPVVFKRDGDWVVDGRGRMTVAEMAKYADFLEARR